MSLAHELAQDRARASYEAIERPPCPSCGRPVADWEWEAHKWQGHGVQAAQPYGKADAREALFLADSPEELDRKIIRWRQDHPGLRLAPLGDGVVRETGSLFARFALVDWKGRPTR